MDPIAAMYRANQAFHEQVLQTAALSCGTAFFSQEFGRIANQVRDVSLSVGASMESAYEEVQAFFSGLGHPCRRWSPRLGQSAEQIESFLVRRGYVPNRRTVMGLEPWPELPARPGVRVLPARPMRAALRAYLLTDPGRGAPDIREASAEMLLARLDDPQFDMLLAMVGNEIAGQGCLLQVGPVAAVYDLYVREEFRGRGCALAILHDTITTCRRLELRNVVLEVGEDHAAAIELSRRCGFRAAGTSVEFFLKEQEP